MESRQDAIKLWRYGDWPTCFIMVLAHNHKEAVEQVKLAIDRRAVHSPEGMPEILSVKFNEKAKIEQMNQDPTRPGMVFFDVPSFAEAKQADRNRRRREQRAALKF